MLVLLLSARGLNAQCCLCCHCSTLSAALTAFSLHASLLYAC